MLIWLWILLASETCGQISFTKMNENEIFDVAFGKFISGADLPNNDPSTSKFGMIRDKPDDSMFDYLKKSDDINNHNIFGKQSFENDMMSIPSSERMLEKLSPSVLDGSLMIVADEDTAEKLVQDSNFIHAKENWNLSQSHMKNSLDFLTVNTPISNLKMATGTDDSTLNIMDYTAGSIPNSPITWSNPQIFIEPVHIEKFHSAHDTFNSSIEFICMLPEVVFCVTDLLSNDSYRLRIVYTSTKNITNFNLPLTIRTRSHGRDSYTSWNASIHFITDHLNPENKIRAEISSMTTEQTVGHEVETRNDKEFPVQPNFIALEEQSVSILNKSSINQSEQATKKPKAPVFIFMPHFEHNNYEIYVPEGKNKDSMIVAVVYFLTHTDSIETKFSIQSEPLQWFYLGEMETETNANRLIIAIKLMLHDGADVDFRKTNNGQYKFQIKASQGKFETSTDINVEVLTFATKRASYSSELTTISSSTETSFMEEFTIPKLSTDSEHYTVTGSEDISEIGPGITTVTIPNLKQVDIDTSTARGSWNIKKMQTEPTKGSSESTGETAIEKLSNVQEIEATESVLGPEFPRVTASRSWQAIATLSLFPEESSMRENFVENFQSTIHDTETTTNAAESETEKRSKGFFFLKVNEITKHQLESVTKAVPSSFRESEFKQLSETVPENWTDFPNKEILNKKQNMDGFEPLQDSEIISVTLPENFQKVGSTNSDIDNLDDTHYISVSSEEGTSVSTKFYKNALTIEIDESTKNNENNNNFSSSSQEQLPVDNNKLKMTAASSIQNSNNLFANSPVEDGKSLQEEFGASFMSLTTTPAVDDSGDNTIDVERGSNTISRQQMSISLTDKLHMNLDYETNESWNQNDNENFEINKLQQTQLTNSDKSTIAVVLHPETIRTETEAKEEWPEEDDSLENGFRISEMELKETMIDMKLKTSEGDKYILPYEFRDSDILSDLDIIITASNMDPNDVIMVSVNSSALEVIPHRMQPGKTVFLAIRDAEKLDRDLLDGPVVVKVTASQRTRPSVTSSKVISIMRDENLSNEAPAFLFPEYDFHISEGSITGQKVGQMEVEFMDHREHPITYQLIGPGNGLNSIPAIVRIHIDDRNDNGPILETLQNDITVSNGRLTKPFVVKVKDNDAAPYNINEISIDGPASAFISLEKVRDDIYYGRLWSLPAAGTYQLNITARDPDGNIPEQKITVNAQVLNTVTKAHFKRAKYERTINTEKLFKGNPILQPELENAPLDTLRFILLRDDPGWLSVDEYTGNVIVGDVPRTGIVSGKYSSSIAALNRTDGRLITESVLVLTVISDSHVKKLFTKKLLVETLRKDPTASRQTIQILPEYNKASIAIVRDSISAVDEQLHHIHIDKNAISNSHGMIIMDMKRLQQIRMLQFNLSSKEDANDSAKVMLFLSSEPVEMEHERKRQAQPRFGYPWRNDMNIIPIKLVENSPEGYTIISLPAYNPMNGAKVMDLRLSGEMTQHFTVDGRSGDVHVIKPFDFEAMESESHIFDLLLIAGEEPYDTVAILRIEIIDVDDNPPKIAKFGDYNFENLTISENSRPGTVLFEVQISDPDYLYGKTGVFNYALSGKGAANFQVKKVNDTVAVIVSPAADLDREKIEEMVILLKVTDSGGNSDSIVAMITIMDVNDNVPIFLHNEYKVEAVENWPEAMVLTYVHAEDKDKGLNADIHFEIDSISGLIRAKKALIGLARAHSYDFSVVASDQGMPPLSATAAVSIHVLESTSLSHTGDNKGIHIVSPSVHFTLQLDENIPANDRVYVVQAKIGGFNELFGREIKYSIMPVDNVTDAGWFTIDTISGDLFTLQELDHELQPAITMFGDGQKR
uniref:Cadherin domain-containing protein n=1 Tax=Wuchereria bancrofti TaxID=6293 RepID=A0A1I8EMH9_WUCBA